jgi:anti-anti-sigma regulatory factor
LEDSFELPSELNIYGAQETRDALLAWVGKQNTLGTEYLNISAKSVEVVDGSGLQVISALFNMEPRCRIVAASDVFLDSCRTLGLWHWIDAKVLKQSQGA